MRERVFQGHICKCQLIMKLVLEGQSINDTLQTFVTCDTTPSDSKNAKVPNLSHLPSVEDFLDALASLDFTLVSESVSEWVIVSDFK